MLILTGDLHNAFAVRIAPNVWEFMTGPIHSSCHPIATAGDPPLGGWFNSEGRKVNIRYVAGFPNEIHYSRLHNKYCGVVRVNNLSVSKDGSGRVIHRRAYDAPQVIVQFYDGHSGELVYAEAVSAADARKPPD